MSQVLMISTCGTSLLTNRAEPSIAGLLRDTANYQQQYLTAEQQVAIDSRVRECRELLSSSDTVMVRLMSAELNGLLGYYNNQLCGKSQDHHVLLHTDTYQGRAVADILEGYLRSHGLNVSKQTFSNLCTDTIENFHHGITELILWCENTLPGYRKHGYRIAFNLTGGFKSIQGWMQTLGMFYADEIVYIFESGRELLSIPRIPVAIDEGARKSVEQHLVLFRQLAPAHRTCLVRELSGVAEVFFYRVGDEAELSPWGRLVWERCRAEIYGDRLQEPPMNEIRYASRFRSAANGLSKDRLVHLNERIDDLSSFLRDRTNPSRLDFKQLRGNPRLPSTHECDAWADQAAWRIFSHFEGNVLILDDLGPGLH